MPRPKPTADQARQKLYTIIEEQLGVNPDQVKPEASFAEDLGADSLEMVELIMSVEEEFDIECPDEDAEDVKTVADAEKLLLEKLEVSA